MWNCHSSPLHVSNNLSGYCISKLVLVSAFGICMHIYALVFPYIFLLVDCFKWSLIGHIEKCRVHSVLWQVWMGGGSIVSFTFPYIFLLVDCFEWALISHIEKQRVHSVLWQFQMGGGSDLPHLGVNWKFELVSSFALASQSSFISVNRNERPITLKSEEFILSSGSFEWGEGVRFTPQG